MASIVEIKDDNYLEYEAHVSTAWGATFLRTKTEEDFATAIMAVLPLTEEVHIIRDRLKYELLVNKLLQKGYSVFVKNHK